MKFKKAAVVLAVLGGVILSGCAGEEPAQTTDPALQDGVWGEVPEETLGIAVDNPYMTFYYPQEWEGKVEEVRTEDGGNTTVRFVTQVSGEDVTLFSIVMGPQEAEGYLLGQLQDPQAGTVNVYSVMNELDPNAWNEEDYIQLCSLQERVNDIIVQFHQDERFVPNL